MTGSEKIVHDRKYHTVYETKNGLGPAPIKTAVGWLHLRTGFVAPRPDCGTCSMPS